MCPLHAAQGRPGRHAVLLLCALARQMKPLYTAADRAAVFSALQLHPCSAHTRLDALTGAILERLHCCCMRLQGKQDLSASLLTVWQFSKDCSSFHALRITSSSQDRVLLS